MLFDPLFPGPVVTSTEPSWLDCLRQRECFSGTGKREEDIVDGEGEAMTDRQEDGGNLDPRVLYLDIPYPDADTIISDASTAI